MFIGYFIMLFYKFENLRYEVYSTIRKRCRLAHQNDFFAKVSYLLFCNLHKPHQTSDYFQTVTNSNHESLSFHTKTKIFT